MVSGEISKSKEIVKPSSPTPPDLKKLQLSFLDQLAPPIYIHIILYFESSHDSNYETTSRKLQLSLSDVLTIYYPLAGRIRENSWVDCNDAGAEYIETLFNDDKILDVIENPKIEELKKYVPAAPSGNGDIPLAVQVNFFGCRGIAIGICVSHMVADAMSMVMFINAWAAACRQDMITIAVTQPSFDLSSRFPLADISSFLALPPQLPRPPEKIVSKRFVFDKQKLTALKKAASGPLVAHPTRVEAVSAFIMKCFIEAVTMKDKINKEKRIFAATHVVDIRQRATPPLPHQFFGNACARAMATAEGNEPELDYYELAIILREAIRKTDVDYIRRLENGEKFLKYYSVNEENDPVFKDGRKLLELCSFTSWSRLPAYEADYGWGRPLWVSIIDVPQKNLISFLGTKSGDGIEVWVNMVEEDMAMIETYYNLLNQGESTLKLL
ncbi:Vinorine synthase [Handroanthus impetiginosus]|uniref:Vinorine synthase n=1 Tax=Handroanthus impetiginosus TaxID=429701 RepID=A0A2G9HEC5_9LAMI|nr:Vinorine synthase [Handroanthus impetiginosus]